MRLRTAAACVGAWILLLVACSEGQPTDDRTSEITVDTLDSGTVRVTSAGDGLWSGGVRWRLVEELRIGAADGGGPSMFGSIGQVSGGWHGGLLVLDQLAQEIRAFDDDGHHIRTIGRRGGGPGELQGAYGFAVDRDARLWVVDGGNARYSVFDSSGTFLFSRPRQLPGVVYPWLGRFGADGRLYDSALGAAEGEPSSFMVFAIDSTGVPVDTFARIVLPQRGEEPAMPIALAMFAPRTTFRVTPDGGSWFGTTDQYTLYRQSARGDTVLIVRRSVEPAELTSAEADSILTEVNRTIPNPLPSGAVPRRRPFFQRLVVEDDGHLWVHRAGSSAGGAGLFDVFDPGGRYLGEVRAPVPLDWMATIEIRGDRLFGVTADSLGVPSAVRLRIERK